MKGTSLGALVCVRSCALACVLPCAAVAAGPDAPGQVIAQVAPQAAPPAARLMALAFPGWHDGAGGRLQTVTLAELPGGAHAAAGWHEGANRVLAEPGPVLRTDATHLTLIAGLVPALQDGTGPAATQATPMALAAHRFEHRGGAWRLAGSQDIFAFRGFAGSASLRAAPLSRRHPALAVEYGSCFDGYCGTWLALFDLDQGTVRHVPAVELALSGINVDSAADCARRLRPLVKPRAVGAAARAGGDAPTDAHDCYAIEGSWEVTPAHDRPGDLVVRYHGAISRAAAPAAAPLAIGQRQVLRYEGGRYRAVSGFNPVPPI